MFHYLRVEFPTTIPAYLPKTDFLVRGYEESDNPTNKSLVSESCNYINCAICLNIARDPVETPCCHHWLCTLCFLDLFHRSNINAYHNPTQISLCIICPYCKQNLNLHQMTYCGALPYDRREVYYRIKVKCPNECGYEKELVKMNEHQVYSCRKRKIFCPNYKCPEVPRDFLSMKFHFLHCPFKRYHCSNCGFPVLISEKENHLCIETLKNLTNKFQLQTATSEDFHLKLGNGGKAFYSLIDINAFRNACAEFTGLINSSSIHIIQQIRFNNPNIIIQSAN